MPKWCCWKNAVSRCVLGFSSLWCCCRSKARKTDGESVTLPLRLTVTLTVTLRRLTLTVTLTVILTVAVLVLCL